MSIQWGKFNRDKRFNSTPEGRRDIEECKSVLLTRWIPKGPFNVGQVYMRENLPDISLYLAVAELLDKGHIKGVHPYDENVRRHDQMAYEPANKEQ